MNPDTVKQDTEGRPPLTANEMAQVESVIANHEHGIDLVAMWGLEATGSWRALGPTVRSILEHLSRGRETPEEWRESLGLALMIGYHLAANGPQRRRETASNTGGEARARKAREKWSQIRQEWDKTDHKLPESERYAAVMRATGVRSRTTIRRALTAR
jgi:hypothetical protein